MDSSASLDLLERCFCKCVSDSKKDKNKTLACMGDFEQIFSLIPHNYYYRRIIIRFTLHYLVFLLEVIT